MEAYKVPVNIRGLGVTSILLGLLGGGFYWWTPLGIALSLFGLVAGFIGWTFARPKSTDFDLVIDGMLLCLAALALDCAVAGLGLELIQFQAFR
jgi:hypothetical protein